MKKREFGTIIQIGDILVSEDVVTEFFSCDYRSCKGICCIEGDGGAPLEESEIAAVGEAYPAFSSLLREEGRKAVAEKGFFEIDRDGDIVTPLTPGTGECAYTHFDEDGCCFCAMERCFLSGGCSFRKPVSCRLYPVRVTRLPGGGTALNLHRWKICRDAYANGAKEHVRVFEFLREPLTDVFGEEFYSALSAAANRLNAFS